MIPDTLRESHNDRAMVEAEAVWLEPDEPKPECDHAHACLGPCCKYRRNCPDPEKLSDYEWERSKE